MTSELSAEPTASLPALYLGHGAPPLLDDAEWMAELNAWAKGKVAGR